MISKGSVISLSAMVAGKIFSQIKYLNISYSGELQVALLTWLPSFISLGLTPDIPESFLDKFPDRNVPFVFEKYEVPSSFLVSFWENLGILFFVTVFWLLVKGIENSNALPTRFISIIRKARVMLQNFLISALYGVYGDLILFSLIEYRTFKFGWDLSLLSFIISIILLFSMFVSFYYQIKILLDYQKIKHQESQLEQFKKTHEGSQVLFRDFKDYSLAPQLFFFFITGRDLVFNFLLATMFEYPLAQTLIITILDCLMIVYLFWKKPFESTFDFVQQIFFEFVGLGVNFSVFINAILDAGKYQTLQARNNVGKLIIIFNLIFNFVTAIFMLYLIVQMLTEFYKEQKEKPAKKSQAFKLQNRLDSSQATLKKNNSRNSLDQSIAPENSTCQNLESSSFQQESIDLDLLPPQNRNLNSNNAHYNSQTRLRKIVPPKRPFRHSRRLQNTPPQMHQLTNYNSIQQKNLSYFKRSNSPIKLNLQDNLH